MDDLQVVVNRLRSVEEAQQAYCCMTEVPTPWPEALCLCRDWTAQNLGRYVEGYHLQEAGGTVIGHLYYAPSDWALIPYEIESGVAVIYCEWVQRRYQGQGFGRRLFKAFVADMQEEEYKGILVEGTNLEGQTHYSHYQTRGFQIIHERDHRKVLYLPLSQSHVEVRPLRPQIRPRRGLPVEILILHGYMCPFDASTQVLLLDVVREFGDQVVVRQEWLTPETLQRYGVAKGIFINGRQKLAGATTEEAIRQAIMEEL